MFRHLHGSHTIVCAHSARGADLARQRERLVGESGEDRHRHRLCSRAAALGHSPRERAHRLRRAARRAVPRVCAARGGPLPGARRDVWRGGVQLTRDARGGGRCTVGWARRHLRPLGRRTPQAGLAAAGQGPLCRSDAARVRLRHTEHRSASLAARVLAHTVSGAGRARHHAPVPPRAQAHARALPLGAGQVPAHRVPGCGVCARQPGRVRVLGGSWADAHRRAAASALLREL
mmetsp:Transcript_13767/g.41502  ORF Transcript_13767/g.41502 Transcript_13767/m.41502 type:complete len:233 (+) Transcript_13767:1254-1952(+)